MSHVILACPECGSTDLNVHYWESLVRGEEAWNETWYECVECSEEFTAEEAEKI